MLVVILPFAFLAALVEWQQQIRIGASLLVIAFGIFLLINPRHPRTLARIPPTQLGVWSFAVAIAHGAGLMLVPIYLGLCRTSDSDSGHEAAGVLISGNLGIAMLVSVVHGAAMIATGGILAWTPCGSRLASWVRSFPGTSHCSWRRGKWRPRWRWAARSC